MKLILSASVATAIAVLSLSVPAPLFSSEASASRMNGKGSGCSEGTNCMSSRYKAASSKKSKGMKMAPKN